MIRMLKQTRFFRGLKLTEYYKLASNFRYYSPTTLESSTKYTLPDHDASKHLKTISAKTQKLQTSDEIPLSYDVIYVSHEYHTIAQYNSAGMSMVFIAGASYRILANFEDIFPDLLTTAKHLWIAGIFLYVNIGVAWLTYRSPVRIYHNKTTGIYKAVFNDLIPTRIRVLEFVKGTIYQIPRPEQVLFNKIYKFHSKGNKFYLHEDFFRYPSDFYNMFDGIDQE